MAMLFGRPFGQPPFKSLVEHQCPLWFDTNTAADIFVLIIDCSQNDFEDSCNVHLVSIDCFVHYDLKLAEKR